MLREFHLADVLTLANAACGLAGVFFAMEYMTSRSPVHFFAAVALSPAALLFDWLDGRVARWRHQQSVLGRELDSLADIISFGVAPAALGFAAGLRGGWDWIASAIGSPRVPSAANRTTVAALFIVPRPWRMCGCTSQRECKLSAIVVTISSALGP